MKYLLIFTFIFLYNISNGQNCENLKTGIFLVKIKDVEFTVKRTERKEVISSENGTIKHTIKWISDCKYILFNVRPKLKIINGDLKPLNFDRRYDTIYNEVTENNEKEFKIVSSGKNSIYKFEYVFQKK